MFSYFPETSPGGHHFFICWVRIFQSKDLVKAPGDKYENVVSFVSSGACMTLREKVTLTLLYKEKSLKESATGYSLFSPSGQATVGIRRIHNQVGFA